MNIYVGNLSLGVTEDELRREFIAFGEVVSVTIMNDRHGNGQSREYGFVEMPSLSQGEAAVTALNGKPLRDTVISVIHALPLSDKKSSGLPGRREIGRVNRRIGQRRYQIS
jgi:RNA recognition motif-containing protein